MESFYQEAEQMQFLEFMALWKAAIYQQNAKYLLASFDGMQKHLRMRNNLPMRAVLLEAPYGSGFSTFVRSVLQHFELISSVYDQLSNLDLKYYLHNFVNFQPGLLKRSKPDVFLIEDANLLDYSQMKQLAASMRKLFRVYKNYPSARPCFLVLTTSDAYAAYLWELRQYYPMIRLKLDNKKILEVLPTYYPSNTVAAHLNQKAFFGDETNLAKYLNSPIAAVAAGVLTRRAEYLLYNYDFYRFQAVECVKCFSDQEYGTAQLFFDVFRRVSGDRVLLKKVSDRLEKAVFEMPFVLNQGRGFKRVVDVTELERQFLETGAVGDQTLGILAELFGGRSAYSEDVALFALHAALQKTSFCKTQTALRLLNGCQIPDFASFEITQASRHAVQSVHQRVQRSFIASSINLSAYDVRCEMFELICGFYLENFVGALSQTDQEALATAAVAAAELGYCAQLSEKGVGMVAFTQTPGITLTENAKRQLCAAVESAGTAWASSEEAIYAILGRYREEITECVEQRYTYHEGVTLAVRVNCKFADLF